MISSAKGNVPELNWTIWICWREDFFAHHRDKLEAGIQAKVYQDMGCQHLLDKKKIQNLANGCPVYVISAKVTKVLSVFMDQGKYYFLFWWFQQNYH